MSVSSPPVVISAAASGEKNGSGLRPRARFNPSRASSAVTSSSSTCAPALAKCAAICAPIVPAPSIATDRIDDICTCYMRGSFEVRVKPPPIQLLHVEHIQTGCHEHPAFLVERHVIWRNGTGAAERDGANLVSFGIEDVGDWLGEAGPEPA